MKKFFIKIFLFFVAVTVIDLLFGHVCQYMNDHSKGGGIKSRHYVCKEAREECIVFGSSRANHHYVPDVIEDSLSLSCYNAGVDGNGIIFSYGTLRMMTARYSPKLIIYDVSRFDIYKDDNLKYLNLLKPFYKEPGIEDIFLTVDPKMKLMMLSNLYRYNTTCLRVFGNFVHATESNTKGYVALKKTMNYEPDMKDAEEKEIDSLKVHFFNKFIQMTQEKGIKLICCVSPSYKKTSSIYKYTPIIELCKTNNIPFFYYENNAEISNEKMYFADRTHMNWIGSERYTKLIMRNIRGVLHSDSNEIKSAVEL